MSGPDVLGSGPDRDRAVLPRPARTTAARRRWAGLAGTVLVGVAAVVLAARSLPEPAAPPPPAPTFAQPEPIRFVADAAVGTKWAYLLVADCVGPEQTRQCRYRVFRRSLTVGSWTPTAVETGPVAGAAGLTRIFVTAGDHVTVVEQPTVGNVLTSPDGGDTVSAQALSLGSQVAAVPEGGVIDLAVCESCPNRLTVLEPRTGRLRTLATPPPLGTDTGVRSFAESGGVLWALGDGGSRLVSAVSLDRGRTWRVLPVGGARAPTGLASLVSDGGRGAYLLVNRDAGEGVLFAELWRIGDPSRPGAAWKQITPETRPQTALGLIVSKGTVLVRDDTGQLWRLDRDGVMRQLRPLQLDGLLGGPDLVVAGPGRLLLGAVNRPDGPDQARPLLSYDGGETWRVERLPA